MRKNLSASRYQAKLRGSPPVRETFAAIWLACWVSSDWKPSIFRTKARSPED